MWAVRLKGSLCPLFSVHGRDNAGPRSDGRRTNLRASCHRKVARAQRHEPREDAKLLSKTLVPNIALRKAVKEWEHAYAGLISSYRVRRCGGVVQDGLPRDAAPSRSGRGVQDCHGCSPEDATGRLRHGSTHLFDAGPEPEAGSLHGAVYRRRRPHSLHRVRAPRVADGQP